jgi:multidrug efflux pump subunit AcrA (membrane-fusion protein)
MSLNKLNAASLAKVAGLLERREKLVTEITRIDAQLTPFDGVLGLSNSRRGSYRASGAPRAERGAVKAAIIDILKSAGEAGITVPQLADKLNTTPQRLHVWFGATGRGVTEIKKIAPGTYAWATPPAAKVRPSPAPKPQPKRRKKNRPF